MKNHVTFQHRHYVKLASIIAQLPEHERIRVAELFKEQLRGTNSNYSPQRFYDAAMGRPQSGRDR